MSALPKSMQLDLYRTDCRKAGVEAAFNALLAQGNEPGFAAMLALRSPPGTGGSEQAFWSGTYRASNGKIVRDDKRNSHGLADMPPMMAEHIIAKARRAGIDIQGKWYMGGLADQRGFADPGAWINDISDIKRVAQKRNLTVRGIVNHEGVVAPPQEKPLSERLIRESVLEMVQENPSLAAKPMQELREAAIDKHGAPARFRKKRKRGPGKSFVDLDG